MPGDGVGGTRVRGARGARSGARVGLSLAPAPRTSPPDAACGGREWRPRQRSRRARQPDAVQLGIALAPDPGLEYEAVRDGGPARPVRWPPYLQDQGLSAAGQCNSRPHAPGQPGGRWGRRPSARAGGLRPPPQPPPHPARRARHRRPQGGHQAGDGQDPRRRLDLRPPAGHPDQRGGRLGRARAPVGPLLRLGIRPRALREQPGAGRGPEAEAQAPGHRRLGERRHGSRRPSPPCAEKAGAGERRLAAGPGPAGCHADPLEQLLLRDAPEAAGGIAGRRQGDDPARRPQGEEVRAAPWNRDRDAERLGPLAGRPRLAATGGAPPRRHAPAPGRRRPTGTPFPWPGSRGRSPIA